MLRVQFEEDLEKLHNQFYAMGNEVLSQINRTVRAFVTHDRDMAKEVIEEDAEVNEYEVKLEKKSLEIIALQQPVSQDLRTVITVLKASSDLERMGDHAVSIAKATIRMKGEIRIQSVEEEIKKMGRDVKDFVESALDLYLNGSVDQAYEVAALDEKINHYFKNIPSRLNSIDADIFHHISKAFIKPKVIPPLHSDKVSEPLVCQLMGNNKSYILSTGYRRVFIN